MTALRTGYERLTTAQAERIDLLCDRFESVCRQGTRPAALETYLGEASDLERPVIAENFAQEPPLEQVHAGLSPPSDHFAVNLLRAPPA